MAKRGGMGVDPEAFAQFFGFSFDFARQSGFDHPEDSIIPIEVALEDVYNGKTIKMSLEREVICGTCKG